MFVANEQHNGELIPKQLPDKLDSVTASIEVAFSHHVGEKDDVGVVEV